MKTYINENFLLFNKTAQRLYHDYAAEMPIIDYHCHLPPGDIAADIQFENLWEIWLKGDHYKWRAMRARGIDESYITGNRTPWEKMEKWASTVPYTLRNPLHHWTHLELLRYFNIDQLLTPENAKEIYEACNRQLQQSSFSVKNLLRRMQVKCVCTTDDPADTLEHHIKLKKDGFEIPVLPSFRPDAAMNVESPPVFNAYVARLQHASGRPVDTWDEYV